MNIPTGLSQWLVCPCPPSDSEALQAANFSAFEWQVFLQKNEDGSEEVGVASFSEDALDTLPLPFTVPKDSSLDEDAEDFIGGGRYVTQVDNGFLVGFNNGEWGGSVWWCNPDGSDFYRVSKDQVVGFLHTSVGVIAPQGISHLSISEGSLALFRRDTQGPWISLPFLDLPEAPDAATLEDENTLLLVTTSGLLRVHLESKRIQVLFWDQFWWCLYPNSVVVTRPGVIYIGMRHGVARVQIKEEGPVVDWLLPNMDFVNAKAELPF
jgi:hypothetical protein